MAWHVHTMIKLDGKEFEVICLSRTRASSGRHHCWKYDPLIDTWNEWCLFNVVLIKRVHANGLAERLTIGISHEKCADGGNDRGDSACLNIKLHRKRVQGIYLTMLSTE